MAVSRGGVAFWVGCVRIHSRRQPIPKVSGNIGQAVNWLWICQTRHLRSASWALAPPNSLRYQNSRQPVASHLFHNANHPQRGDHCEEDWEESRSVCVLELLDEFDSLPALLELPLFGPHKLGTHLPLGAYKLSEFPLPLTTVEGRREADINIDLFRRRRADATKKEPGCFGSLFQAEKCPAPFMSGSRFYCFHCPGTEPMYGGGLKFRRQDFDIASKPAELPRPCHATLCTHPEIAEVGNIEGDSEEEEKLALMYERLRIELPGILIKNHDYNMYSNDMEFINGLINANSRGRSLYQFTVSLWRLLCLCYYAEARLEVLMLTKHMEDRTIRARWRIRGLPFHSLCLRFYRKDKSPLYRSFDAFSTFYIGHDGLIHCHKVEKVMPAEPPPLPRINSLLAGVLVALGVQEHRPALNLLPLLLSSVRH